MVAFAIMAVLAALVLASMGAAKKAARRTVCANNLRQVGLAMTQYATENQGMVPLIYEQFKQATYMVWSGSGLTRGWGMLSEGDYMDTPQVFYCPTVTSDLNLRYNVAGNIWKNPGTMTRASYNLRPETFVASSNQPPAILPLFKNYSSKAIAADACSQPNHLLYMHQNGLNVVYGGGNVRWVDRNLMAPTWRAIPTFSTWQSSNDAAGTALWNGFDALR